MRKKIIITLCSLGLLASMGWAGTPGLEGIVKDASGHPIKGADVKIEATEGTLFKTIKTDANGHYLVGGLTMGIPYKVTLVVNGTVKASILNAQPREGKPNQLNFDLKQARGPLKTHKIWVAGETGTNFGGHWATVDENGNIVDDNADLQKASGRPNGRPLDTNPGVFKGR